MADKIIISESELIVGLIKYFEKNFKDQGGWVQIQNRNVVNALKSFQVQRSGLGPEQQIVTITKKEDKLTLELS